MNFRKSPHLWNHIYRKCFDGVNFFIWRSKIWRDMVSLKVLWQNGILAQLTRYVCCMVGSILYCSIEKCYQSDILFYYWSMKIFVEYMRPLKSFILLLW